MNDDQLEELLYQALETELGGVKVYETALGWVLNDDLREESEKYREQTTRPRRDRQGHPREFGLDPSAETPGRRVVRHIGTSLVEAMDMALESGPKEAAELVAAECVTLAETKDHLNWELVGEAAKRMKGEKGKALHAAYGRSRRKKTNTSITRRAGPTNSGSSPWACRLCCRRRKSRKTSRQLSVPRGRSRSAQR